MNSLQGRILLNLVVLAIFIIALTILGRSLVKKASSIRDLQSDIASTHTSTISLLNKDLLLFSQESIVAEFYTDPTFKPIVNRNEDYETVLKSLEEITSHKMIGKFYEEQMVNILIRNLIKYNRIQQEILELHMQRGFKDEGLEGRMRDFAHNLESYGDFINLSDLLSLRRHEKDYFLRDDLSYVTKFNNLNLQLQQQAIVQYPDKTILTDLLENYAASFNRIVEIERQIGGAKLGLTKQLLERQEKISSLFSELRRDVNQKTDDLISALFTQYIAIIFLGFSFSAILSILIARFASYSIKNLADGMENAIKSGFSSNIARPHKWASTESVSLYKSYQKLIGTLRNQFRELEKTNKTLADQNNKLSVINKKLAISESELRESNAVKDKFFTIIGHDLKNPMATLTGLLQILFEDIHNFSKNENEEFAQGIMTSANSISLLLENLLAWSRAQTDQLVVRENEVNIAILLHNNQKLFSARLKEKNIELSIRSKHDLEAFADQDMLDFIFRNLLDNAIKFTPENGSVIVIAKEIDDEISVSFTDNGMGIPEDLLEKLFREQADVERVGTAGEKGTGLGLLLCQEFARINNGSISVKSSIGKGTTFIVKIPKNRQSIVNSAENLKLEHSR